MKICIEPIFIILFIVFFMANVPTLNIVTPVLVYIFYTTISIRTMTSNADKLKSVIIYTLILGGLNTYTSIIDATLSFEHKYAFLLQFVYIIALLAHSMTMHLITLKNYQISYFYNRREMLMVPFSRLKEIDVGIKDFYSSLKNVSNTLSPQTILYLLGDLKRAGFFIYTSKDSLGEEYFENAEKSLADPNVYIIVSDTGSPASQVLSLFSKKVYNHVSVSFDYDLNTIISYNGGERVNPPGLNLEAIEFFNKKDDASIMVYRLPVELESKRKMIDKIKQINTEGSAYNAIGMAVQTSFKPNTMFCSQFVYALLLEGNVTYFDKECIDVRPSDFVEQDYRRKLSFEYEVNFKKEKQKNTGKLHA